MDILTHKENIMKKFRLFVIISLLINIFLVLCACATEKLSAPVNIDIDIEDQLIWKEVDDARNYLVEIVAENGETKELAPKKATVSLANLAEGDYEIRIKAISGFSNVKNSDWSEVVYFEKGYETGCIYKLINNNTEYAIIKYGKAGESIRVQDEYRKKPVTEIAEKAFKGYGKIENVVVGKNVKTIGAGAFQNCKNLKTISLPNTLTSIGESAFQSCGSLQEINIPTSITILEDYTFAYCRQLKDVILPEGLTSVGDYAFSDCATLTKVVIPDSVETIGTSAFTGSLALKELTIGKNVTKIGLEAFQMCYELETLNFSNEGNLLTIEDSAFRDCRKLESVLIPEGVKTIGDYAFYMSQEEKEDEEGNKEMVFTSLLDEISIPSTVTRVGGNAFYGSKYYVEALENDDFVYLNNWLLNCKAERKATITEIDETILQSGLVGIADMVFENCIKLETVEIPASVKYIGKWTFSFNPELGTVKMSNVEIIHEYAFKGNENLYSVLFGTKLETIGNYAFNGCKGLNIGYLKFPKTLLNIGTEAFLDTYNPSSSASEVLYAGNKDDGWWVVGYKGAISQVTLKDNTIGIADYAFYRCSTLTWIENMGSLQYVGEAAFYGCASLEGVGGFKFSKVTELKDYTFSGCASLYEIELPVNLKSVGRSAFYKCAQLSTINLAATTMKVTSIGEYAFYQCLNLKTIQLGKHLTSLGKYAFYKCLGLESISLPESLTMIDDRTFYKCETLASVTLGNSVESIGPYAFTGCKALTRIRFPDSLKNIDKYAFFNCEALTYITFGQNLESIGEYAFYSNVAIRSLV